MFCNEHQLSEALSAQILAQSFAYLNAVLVNALMDDGKYCKAGTAFSVKVSLSHLEQWINTWAPKKYTSWVADQLQGIREASNTLLIDKRTFQHIEDVRQIFPTLQLVQIHKILTQFTPDDYDPDHVPETSLEVLQQAINRMGAKKKPQVDEDTLVSYQADTTSTPDEGSLSSEDSRVVHSDNEESY